jgi:trigger factor
VSLGEGYAEGQDATLTVALEVLPVISAPDLSGLKLEKLVVPVAEEALDEAVQRVASSAKRFNDAEEGKLAETGDQLIIDFLGKLDGVPFDGGQAEDAALEIGSGRFIPGFEEQLVGAKVGDEKVITVTFPRTIRPLTWPARKPPSTSPSRASRLPPKPSSTTNSPRAWA